MLKDNSFPLLQKLILSFSHYFLTGNIYTVYTPPPPPLASVHDVFHLGYFSLSAVDQLNRVIPLHCRKHCLWPTMETWTCDRPFKEPGADPGPQGASQIGRSSLIPENGEKFGTKCVFITFSFNIWPGRAFIMEQGISGMLSPCGSVSLGGQKKQEEKNWKSFSLYLPKRTKSNWLMRKQNTTNYYTTMHYISAFFNYYFFKLVFSVFCFSSWCSRSFHHVIYMNVYTQAWSSSSTKTKRDCCISPSSDLWPLDL